jgi:hypothetical protein
VLTLVPFSGIAFLWFTGVIRDLVGDRKDRLFATVFLGSGILYVGMLFVWAASFGAIFRTFPLAASGLFADNDIYIFGFAFMQEILGNYSLRMAGVYMLSISSLWTRAGVMPRWTTLISTLVALGFLFFAGTFRVARYVFPGWVFLVSVYILVLNYWTLAFFKTPQDVGISELSKSTPCGPVDAKRGRIAPKTYFRQSLVNYRRTQDQESEEEKGGESEE